MAGLAQQMQSPAAPVDGPMAQGAAPAAAPTSPPPGAADDAAGAEPGQQPASPEEQAQYEKFVRASLEILYPPDKPGEPNPAILQNLQGKFEKPALAFFEQAQPPLTDSPLDSAAATTVIVTMMTENTGGEKFADDVVYHGGKAIAEELIEMAEAAKIHEFSEQDLETVTYRAVDLYRIASPRADPVALTEAFKTLMEANDAGTLNKVLPGLPGGDAMPQKAA